MFCTAGKVTKNTGRTVEVMETNRWHEDSSNFSGTWIKKAQILFITKVLLRSLSLF